VSKYFKGKKSRNASRVLDKKGCFFYIVTNITQGECKCPAEESANCEKSPLINARKNCGKTDIKTNNQLVFI